MKVQKIKELIIWEIAENYRKDPDGAYKPDAEDAQKFGVPLKALEDILRNLEEQQYLSGFYGAWKITVHGLETLEEEEGGEADEAPGLRERVDQLEERVKVLEEALRRLG